MASVPNLLNQVIHYVYTWIPKTTKKAVQRKMKVSKKRKKRVNFAQPIKERNSIDCQHLSDLQSSHRPPSMPALSKLVLLHTYPVVAEKQERISPKFSNCDLKVVGISSLSKEKKVSKRSALKKWLHQRENVVRDRNVPFDKSECSHGNDRHNLCFEKIFDYSPRFADSQYQDGLNVGLRGMRKIPRKIWSREAQNRTADTEQCYTTADSSEPIDLNESLSVIRLRSSYE